MIFRKSSFAVAPALLLAFGPAPACAANAKIDKPAPKFSLSTFRKEKLNLEAIRGKVVIINRWATWCVPCRQEFLLFDKYATLRGKYGFTIIAIESGGSDARGPMRKLAEMVSFPVVLEAQAHAGAYPIINNGVPTNYVIDRAGVVRYAKAGAFTLETLEAAVLPLLKEAPSPDVASTPGGEGKAAPASQ